MKGLNLCWKTGLILMLSLPGMAMGNRVDPKILHAGHLSAGNIVLDGKLTEAVWQTAEKGANFIQRNPNDGRMASMKTEFSILYDDNYLYAGIRAWDDDPDQISRVLTRRDDYVSSDWVYISLDSYNDNRTAFEFGLNAAGVKHDLRRYDDDYMDDSWDAVWDGKVNVDEYGWTAEFRIPFRELRFNSSEDMEWGLLVYRELPRFGNEISVWNYWSQNDKGFVSNYGRLEGLKSIHATNPLYISPYIVSSRSYSETKVNSLHSQNFDAARSIGGDIRYAFSNGLTFNATLNPDFGQVEADPAEFNLTQFESYFSEKRPFFIEGSNIFNFDGIYNNGALLYSRRIGRSPHGFVRPDSETVYMDRPDRTRILGAAKMTGKTDRGLSIGVLSALTDEEVATEYLTADSVISHVVEPVTTYSAGRLIRDFRDGQVTLGAIMTAVNRQLSGSGLDGLLHRNAYSGGMDFSYEFPGRNYALASSMSLSRVEGRPEAIVRTQTAPNHYFQRPDAGSLTVDSSAASLSGYTGYLAFKKTTGPIRGELGMTGISPGYEINDLGYLQASDIREEYAWLQYRMTEPGRILRSYNVNLNQFADWTFDGQLFSRGGNINGSLRTNSNVGVYGGAAVNLPGLNFQHLRGGPAIATALAFNAWIGVDSDDRKDVSCGYYGFIFTSADGVSAFEYSPYLNYRPAKNLQLSLNPDFYRLDDTWAWVGSFRDENGQTRYIFSDFLQNTLRTTLRLDYTLSTDLSIQFYVQPYITAGHYETYREVDQNLKTDFSKRFHAYTGDQLQENVSVTDEKGRTRSYDFAVDRNSDGVVEYLFNSPDFNYKQMNSNLVVRWEYSAGSSLYLVWSSGRADQEASGNFRVVKDAHRLLSRPGDNVFLLKFSYLLNV